MPFCSNCGTEMKQSMLFCPTCGAKAEDVIPAQQPAAPQPRPNPVQYQQPQYQYQPQYQVYAVPVYQAQPKQQKPPKVRFALVSLATGFGFVAIGVLIWYLVELLMEIYATSSFAAAITFWGPALCGIFGLLAHNAQCKKYPLFNKYKLPGVFAFVPAFAFMLFSPIQNLLITVPMVISASNDHYMTGEMRTIYHLSLALSSFLSLLVGIAMVIVLGIVFVSKNNKKVDLMLSDPAYSEPFDYNQNPPIALFVVVTTLLVAVFCAVRYILTKYVFEYDDSDVVSVVLNRVIWFVSDIGVLLSGFIGSAVYNSICRNTIGKKRFELPIAFVAIPGFCYSIKYIIYFLLCFIPESIYYNAMRYGTSEDFIKASETYEKMTEGFSILSNVLLVILVAVVSLIAVSSYVKKVKKQAIAGTASAQQNIQ